MRCPYPFMDPKSFVCEKTGHIEWSDNGQFCYFRPNSPPFDITHGEHINRSFRVLSMISKLDGRISNIPEKGRSIMIRSFAIKEATTSSAIEGSRSTVSDIYRIEKEAEKNAERAMDNREVINYINALMFGIQRIKEKSMLTEELILSTHKILMEGVRGKDKQPGSYRNGQVWIGDRKATLENAEFVPPSPHSIQYLMNELLEYMNGEDDDPVQRIAVSHYQFETIHPFRDGNGRMGRLIIMLLLYKEGIMDNPFLYLSEYFNKYRNEYIDDLTEVRTKGDLNKWIRFFLDALESQAQHSMNLIDSLEMYRNELRNLAVMKRDAKLDIVGEMLMENPYITSRDIIDKMKVSGPTANKLLGILVSEGVLEEVEGKRKGMLYKAPKLLAMLENA